MVFILIWSPHALFWVMNFPCPVVWSCAGIFPKDEDRMESSWVVAVVDNDTFSDQSVRCSHIHLQHKDNKTWSTFVTVWEWANDHKIWVYEVCVGQRMEFPWNATANEMNYVLGLLVCAIMADQDRMKHAPAGSYRSKSKRHNFNKTVIKFA